jgi:glycerate-2-kinase
MREHLLQVFQSALEAVQPQALLPAWVEREGDRIRLADQHFRRSEIRHLYVVAVGKAAAAMGDTLEQILGNAISEGIVITKKGHGLSMEFMRCIEAGHPVPDAASLEAAYAVENMLRHVSERDLVLVLLSGGASSLMADLVPGVEFRAISELFDVLLRSGADIREMNTVRKHFSRLKGGQLARLAAPARLLCFALSDVTGDAPDVIGSGPTVPDPTTYGDAYVILEKYGLLAGLDRSLASWLDKGLRGEVPETPKPADPVFHGTRFYLIGNSGQALEAASAKALSLGYAVLKDTPMLRGESREQAWALARDLESYSGPRPACILLGGETTVTVKGNGRGGRNQEFALALLQYWQEKEFKPEQVPVVLCTATDGTDGPTDASGALVDGQVLQWSRDAGMDPAWYLERNDSYTFFEHSGAQFFTGPTHTNVMDMVIALLP